MDCVPHCTESSPGHGGERLLPEVTGLIRNRHGRSAGSCLVCQPVFSVPRSSPPSLEPEPSQGLSSPNVEASEHSIPLGNFSNLPA